MFKLYYINKKHNVARCLGSGLNKFVSINNSKSLILNYLNNKESSITDISSSTLEDDLSLRFALDEVVFESDNELFMFGENLEGLEQYKSIDRSLISDTNVDLKFIYNTFDLDNVDCFKQKRISTRSRLNSF